MMAWLQNSPLKETYIRSSALVIGDAYFIQTETVITPALLLQKNTKSLDFMFIRKSNLNGNCNCGYTTTRRITHEELSDGSTKILDCDHQSVLTDMRVVVEYNQYKTRPLLVGSPYYFETYKNGEIDHSGYCLITAVNPKEIQFTTTSPDGELISHSYPAGDDEPRFWQPGKRSDEVIRP